MRPTRKAPPGTVLALKPSPALQISATTTVAEAAQLMAAKREDCVLVTDEDDHVAGIFTAKDLAFRVVGGGKRAQNVTIAEIMTKNPLCAKTDTSATDALATPFTRHASVEVPLICGAMYPCSNPELVAAVSAMDADPALQVWTNGSVAGRRRWLRHSLTTMR